MMLDYVTQIRTVHFQQNLDRRNIGKVVVEGFAFELGPVVVPDQDGDGQVVDGDTVRSFVRCIDDPSLASPEHFRHRLA